MLGDQALVGLSSLALLDLSRNNLHTIGPATLRPLVSLQVLRVTGKGSTKREDMGLGCGTIKEAYSKYTAIVLKLELPPNFVLIVSLSCHILFHPLLLTWPHPPIT